MSARKHADPSSVTRLKAAAAPCAHDLQHDAGDALNFLRRQFSELLFYANDASSPESVHGVDFCRAVVAERTYEILMSLNQVEDYVASLHDKAALSERGAR